MIGRPCLGEASVERRASLLCLLWANDVCGSTGDLDVAVGMFRD